jgi:hypothetical protein
VIGGRYELRIRIGNGGMGTVWRATDTLLRREVAVKEVILPPTMPRNEQDALCERTMREARAAAALSHPSVVRVYDVVTDRGRPWIVMELLDARSLADMVIDDGPLAQRVVAKIGVAMLGALEVAHAAGVLHRDVKPANVLVCADGRCVLTDFGVARLPTESNLTTPGMVLGSPHFISPERAVGGAFGPPSDLFSLGVTLYTAVEGGPPFDRGDPFETMRAVVEEAPRPPRIAGPLQPILMGLLDKEPSRRWSVDQARVALRELLTGPLSRSGHAHAHNETDPHAVMRPTAPPPPPAIRDRGTGPHVGGRAMLDPDESLTGQLARLRGQADGGRSDGGLVGGGRSDARPLQGPAPGPRSGPDPRQAEFHTGEMHPDAWRGQPQDRQEERPPRTGAGRRRAKSGSAIMADQVRGKVRAIGREAGVASNQSRLIAAAGVVLVLAGAGFLAFSGVLSGGPTAPTPQISASANPSAAAAPLIPVQEYRDKRGLVVNVPKDWKRSGSSYVDFNDPDGERKVRINVENASSTAERFFTSAESGLKRQSTCADPYQRVDLRDAQLDGRDGAEFEYTCGSGNAMRHGIWRAIVVDGRAYHFYLTVPDSRFAGSKVIFDEMVRSFKLV